MDSPLTAGRCLLSGNRDLPAKKIMLVEDEIVCAMDLKHNLIRRGYEVPAIVASGEAAICRASEVQPDLILMDIALAGAMSGIEAAAEIRKSQDIPIVFLTAHADADTIAQAKATEPFGYLPKPCNMTTMVSTIEMALYRSEADAARRKADAELRRLREAHEAEMAKSRNLESLGILAGGIAHDFNNLFQVLIGNLSLAKMCTPVASDAFKYLEKAENIYEQAIRLTGQFTVFAAGGSLMRVDIHPARYIRETVTANLSGSGVAVDFDLPDDLWLVSIDPGQFRQVLEHMVTNAREAMPAGGRLRVAAENECLPQGNAHRAIPAGNYVRISIQDQGGGICPEDLSRIFDPYFSSKQRGSQKGMGLGLAVCNTIIQKNGGAITVDSAPGQGATFHIQLPAVSLASETQAITKELAGDGPRILIMDDEVPVTEVAAQYLRHHGYRVDSATNGEEAVAAYQEARTDNAPYAAVILDLEIPGGMGGMEACSRLRGIDPAVTAIVSSGYSDDPVMTDFAGHGFADVLLKPYHLHTLKEVLERLL